MTETVCERLSICRYGYMSLWEAQKAGYEVLASEQLAPEESPPELAPEHSAIV